MTLIQIGENDHGENIGNDHTDVVVAEWDSIHPGWGSIAIVAVLRLERLAKVHDQLLVDTLRPFHHQGVRNMEDFRLLAILRRTPGGVTITQASSDLLITKPATSARAERFQQDGLIERSIVKSDRRSASLTLTQDGIAVVDEILDAISRARETLLEPLAKAQQQQLADCLKAVLAPMKR